MEASPHGGSAGSLEQNDRRAMARVAVSVSLSSILARSGRASWFLCLRPLRQKAREQGLVAQLVRARA